MKISSIFQFIIGFILGVLLLASGSAGAAYYFFTRMAASPAKPIFSEEKPPEASPTPETKVNSSQKPEKQEVAEAPKAETNSETEKPETKKEEKKLEPGAYYGRVTWSSGLSVRAEPNTDSNRVGGIGYNQKIIILQESEDKQWQKIRIIESEQEGWVKSGNIQKVEADE